MRHVVRDVSRVLTLFLASRQAWPKILGVGKFRCLRGEVSPKRSLDKTLSIESAATGRGHSILIGAFIYGGVGMRGIPVSEKYRGAKSIIYRGLAKYRPQHST